MKHEAHEIKISEQYLKRTFFDWTDQELLQTRYEYQDALWKIKAEIERRGIGRKNG